MFKCWHIYYIYLFIYIYIYYILYLFRFWYPYLLYAIAMKSYVAECGRPQKHHCSGHFSLIHAKRSPMSWSSCSWILIVNQMYHVSNLPHDVIGGGFHPFPSPKIMETTSWRLSLGIEQLHRILHPLRHTWISRRPRE